uniref:Aminopeptidase n=1 Tax=Plectus sambesii TaxID=2011161 RepID=A0A914WBS3_9BILA
MRPALLLLVFALLLDIITSDDVDYLYRLPAYVRPISYDLKLSIDSESQTTSGEVSIEVYCLKNTTEVTLHAHPSYLLITHATCSLLFDNDTYYFDAPTADWRSQTLTFSSFNHSILMQEGSIYTLTFWFNATLSTDGWGLSWHDDGAGGVWLNALFQLSHARRLFPCFDEPKWKASFKLELWLSGDFALDSYVALSNGVSTKTAVSEELVMWTFDPTPPISTYLFTMSIGKFASYCEVDVALREELCVWQFAHLQDWHASAAYTIHLAAKYDFAMTSYLNIDSPSKLHFLIVPVRVNGMESYGLISIKSNLWPTSTGLEENSTGDSLFESRQRAAFEYTVVHELAHQWFGNLVTPVYWSHVWLSESLASLISGFDAEENAEVMSDLSEDALVSDKWAEGISRLVYRKGTAVLRMLQSVIGHALLRLVLLEYLDHYQFAAASTEDFLTVLSDVTSTHNLSFDASAFLKDWLYQGSYPIVEIYFDKETVEFYFSQHPRLGNKLSRWMIPIWSTCLLSNVTNLWWISKKGLLLNLADVTSSSDTAAVVWNKNEPVYYEISERY